MILPQIRGIFVLISPGVTLTSDYTPRDLELFSDEKILYDDNVSLIDAFQFNRTRPFILRLKTDACAHIGFVVELDIGFGRPDTAFVAVPALIKKLPLPLRSWMGDLSDTGRVLFGLDFKPEQ